MDRLKLKHTQEVLRVVDATTGNMKINRLQVLIELAAAGGDLTMSDMINRLGVARAHASKLVASWSTLTHLKEKGPGYVEVRPDPMNLNTRMIRLTRAGKKYVEQITGN